MNPKYLSKVSLSLLKGGFSSRTCHAIQVASVHQAQNYHDLPKKATVVVCGGGAIGNSVAYHLVQQGITDVVVLDQGRIGSGVTWRGNGLVGHFHSASEGKITEYSTTLYKELQEQGYDIGWQNCGALNIARTKDRMILLQRMVSEIRVQGLECEVIGPKDIEKLFPLIKTDDLEGGVFVPGDGYVNPLNVCKVLAHLAQQGGAKYYENCRVKQILVQNDRVYGVETEKGVILCDIVALCTGMWSRQLGLSNTPRFKIPIHAAERTQALTYPVPGLPASVPTTRDYDGHVYFRHYNNGLLIGGFWNQGKPVFSKDVPSQFEFQQLPWDWDLFCKPIYEEAKKRLPALASVEIETVMNGPDTFTPDGKWILGETSEIDKLFVAVGSNGNPVQAAGGLGRALASWIISGEPEAYLLPFDVRRFIDVHNNRKYLRERVQETVGRYYTISHPLMTEFRTARKQRTSPLYSVQEAAGAVFGERMGFERALFFDQSKPLEERRNPPPVTFGMPSWFECVKEEYYACRERVGVIDMSSYTKLKIQSKGQEVVNFLQLLCSNDVDVPIGTILQTGMHNERGGYENDCVLLRKADSVYFMVSPTAQQTRIREWLQRHLPQDGSVSIRDVTSMYTVLNVVGPKSKELLKVLTQSDMDLLAFTYCKMNVGYASDVLVMGFSNTGEPGYSLYIPSEYALHVYGRLMSVGRDFGIKDVGYYTLRFLRIEKFIPFWGEELDSNTTPFEIGREDLVKLEKGSFLGKKALQEQLKKGIHKQLVHFQLENHNAFADLWPWGREPIFRNDQYVGMTTSSGYGFTLQSTVCQGFVQNIDSLTKETDVITTDYILNNAKYEIEIAGKRFSAKACINPPYIPTIPMMGSTSQYIPQARLMNASIS